MDSAVIYPPVRVSELQSVAQWADHLPDAEINSFESIPQTFILGASRFVPYKELERVIEVGEFLDLPVVLAGGGPEEARLRERAQESAVPVHFVINPSDQLLFALYQAARLFVFPPIEDFGIMPVEAMALGTPSLVNREGGASESVDLVEGGAATDFLSSSDTKSAAARAASMPTKSVAERTRYFSNEEFRSRIVEWMGKSL